MKIGYVRLDRGDWANNNYNSQEIGLAKAFEELGHQTYIFSLTRYGNSFCSTISKPLYMIGISLPPNSSL